MPEYTIIAKIDPSGVSAGRAKISQELAGIEADARRTGATSSASLGALGSGAKGAAADAGALAAAAQASARAAVAQGAAFDTATKAVRLNSVAMRETLVVARELSRGNFTRLPGSLTLLGQGISTQGGIAAYGSALLNTLGILKTTQDAELALAAQDAATAAAGVRGAAERAQANILAADTEIALAQSAVVNSTSSATEAAAQARLTAAHEAVAAAAADATIAEDALAVSEAAAATAAVASAEATSVALSPVAIVLGVVAAAAAALYLIFRNSESDVQKAADKLEEHAKKADVDREAHDLFAHTLLGVEEALRKEHDAIEKANEANKTSAEISLQNAAINEQRLQGIYKETEANLELAKSRLAVAMADPNRGTNLGTAGLVQADEAQRQLDDLTKAVAKARSDATGAVSDYTNALANYAVSAGERDPADVLKRKYEGPGGLIDQAKNAALAASAAARAAGDEVKAHRLVTTELTKQIELLHQKEKAELAAQQRAEADAKRQGSVLALPISGGRITTRFGQIESGVGVGPHAHQGLDIATPVGTPVYARSGGTVDFARQQGGYGNVIQINFGGGTTARYGHLQRFNVKPGDVVEAGDVIGYSGGARGAEGAGDSTGPHLHYEERFHGKPVNPLTAKVTTDTEAAQDAGYRKAAERQAAAEKKATEEKNFIDRTVDEAEAKSLPKIDKLGADIRDKLAAYKRQFGEAMKPGDVAKITHALTDADAREVADHFQKAYVDPLKPLQDGIGKTAVEQAILNAEQKEATDRGGPLSDAQKKLIENYYQQEDVLKREDELIRGVRQPLEDYRNTLLAINKALVDGKIDHSEYNAQITKLHANATDFLKDLPGTDPVSGRPFADVAARSQEDARAAQQQDQIENLKKQGTFDANNNLLQTGDRDTYQKTLLDIQRQYEAQMEASHQQHTDNMNAIDAARRDMQLSYGQAIADSVYQIAVDAFGKHSALARAAFAVEKGFVIARASLALYDDVAQAMAKGWPANIPLIAQAFAEGAVIVGAIRSIVVPSAQGFEAGGYTGDLGRSTPAGVVHGQEFVVNADGTARFRPLLQAINSGQITQQSRAASNDNGGSGARPLSVQVHNYAPGVEFETRQGATPDEVEVIARRVVRQDSAKTVAADLASPNSRTSKAMNQHFGVPRKRA